MSIALLSLTLVTAAVLLVLAAPASAKKTHVFLEDFGSAAQPSFKRANGLAVDLSSGDLLVIDSDAETLSRFKPNGEPDPFSALGTNVIDAKSGIGGKPCAEEPASCDKTPQGSFSFGDFAGTDQVAVDSSGTVTDGNIYVTQGRQSAGNLIDVFAASGEYIGQLTGAGPTPFGTGGGFSPCGVAVDETGNLFVAGGSEDKIYKFDPSANPPLSGDLTATYTDSKTLCNLAAGAGPSAGSVFANTYFTEFPVPQNSVLKLDSTSLGLQYVVDPGLDMLVAVDPTGGHLYAVRTSGEVREYDASGASGADLASTFQANSGIPLEGKGIATNLVGNRVYISSGKRISVYGPLVTVPDVTTGAATITGDTSATVNGTVNPDGVPLEECRFEYGTSVAYGMAYGQTVPCVETPAEIGTTTKAVHADLSGLEKETLYHFRLVAKNVNATIDGPDQTFKTPGKPAIDGAWASEVGFSEATLAAAISPENSPTTYHFEWGTDSTYGHSTPERSVGTDASIHTVSDPLSGLEPGTAYHWRVVASNGVGISEGPDRVLRTFRLPAPNAGCANQAFRAGAAVRLPDCRAYEMVSPVDKLGGDVASQLSPDNSAPAELPQSSPDGERLTYSTFRAFGDSESAPFTNQYLASRDPGSGWVNEGISPPRQGGSLADTVGFDTQFELFSEDLCHGWLLEDSPLVLSPDAAPGYMNLYRRDNCGPTAYEALTTVKPTSQTVPHFIPNMQGASADGSRAVFRANDKLTKDASNAKDGGGSPIYQLYEAFEGQLSLISTLPDGSPNATSSFTGYSSEILAFRHGTLHNAVSADGSRVYWTALPSAATDGPGTLYLRLNAEQKQSKIVGGECSEPARACTVAVSESVGGPGSSEPARFWGASADGSKAIFSFRNGPLSGELYRYDLATGSATPIAGQVKVVPGVSEDASRAYFVSGEALAPGAVAGKNNLYLHDAGEGGGVALVATLLDKDAVTRECNFFLTDPFERCSRVSPDGGHFAFPSTDSLTGYDNRDAEGRPAVEVYLYDATANGGEGTLICASCNPSGSRPQVREMTFPEISWFAAKLGGQRTAFHASRFLSDDGQRLFFESFDALTPRDTNGRGDVYQWEAAGRGDCTEASASFSPLNEGCINLISSGESPQDSEFVDASSSGDDVFFKTGASLLEQDEGLVDIYDARTGGGFPPPPDPPAACEGEACQGAGGPPNDPTPASAAFRGPGNLIQKPPRPRCGKGKARRKGRCVARKQKRAKAKQNRANDNRRASR